MKVTLNDAFKQIKAERHILHHKFINHIANALSDEISQAAGIVLNPPVDKRDSGKKIKLKLIYSGDVTENQKQQISNVIQQSKNPVGLVNLLEKHKPN